MQTNRTCPICRADASEVHRDVEWVQVFVLHWEAAQILACVLRVGTPVLQPNANLLPPRYNPTSTISNLGIYMEPVWPLLCIIVWVTWKLLPTIATSEFWNRDRCFYQTFFLFLFSLPMFSQIPKITCNTCCVGIFVYTIEYSLAVWSRITIVHWCRRGRGVGPEWCLLSALLCNHIRSWEDLRTVRRRHGRPAGERPS